MRKLLFLSVLLLSAVINAQNNDKQTISVSGHSKFIPEIAAYKAIVFLQLTEKPYNNPTQFKTLEELKDFYIKNLKKQGIDTSKITEDELSYYSALGSYGDSKGTILTIETPSKEDMIKISKERYGEMIFPRQFLVRYREDVNYEKALKEALADAQMKASKIAKELSVELGKIKQVVMGESKSYYSYWNGYDVTYPSDYSYLTVNVDYFTK